MIIDSHNHFWKYDPSTHGWIDDNMTILRRDFLPPEFSEELKANGIDGTISVQADQSLKETQFLLELSAGYEFIKGVVGWVDLQSEDISEQLEVLKDHKGLVGFRHIVQSEPNPNFLLGKNFRRGLAALENRDFTYDVLVVPTQLDAVCKTVEELPNQKFVIDHLAKPYIQKKEMGEWKKHIKRISDHENVMCKLSGMVTEAHWQNWTYDDLVPFIDVVVEAFGTDRIMYGSDWPVCLLAAEYSEVKEIISRYVNNFSDTEKTNVFGLNALKFYGL
ncbi:MAG: amidohydrolase family protein [Ekhidna sp.]|nr:amidohydrolase family protein [Ekhidna sp.]